MDKHTQINTKLPFSNSANEYYLNKTQFYLDFEKKKTALSYSPSF